MHSKFRATNVGDECYPCCYPMKTKHHLHRPGPQSNKTICADRICCKGVDPDNLIVCTTTADNADVTCGITRVGGAAIAAPRCSCVPPQSCRSSLTVGSAAVYGSVLLGDRLNLKGPCIKNSSNSKGPLLLDQQSAAHTRNLWDISPDHFCYGETVIILYKHDSLPKINSIPETTEVSSVNIKRFHDVTLQRLDVVDDTADAWHCYVRAKRGSHMWTPWRKLHKQDTS